MTYGKWVVDDEYPEGRLVEMTPEEQAQLERDQAAGAELAANQAAIDAAAAARIADLLEARVALASGTIFRNLSVRERRVLDMLIDSQVMAGASGA